METDEIYQRVINIVTQKFSPKEILSGDKKFAEDIGADSLDQAELIMDLEEEFIIQIPDGVAKEAKTIDDAVRIIHNILHRQA